MIGSTSAAPTAGRCRRRAAVTIGIGLTASLGSCLWSTADVLAEANLELDLVHVPDGAAVVRVTVVDAAGAKLSREAARSAESMTVFVGRLATGKAVITTELVASSGAVLAAGCRQDGVQIGTSGRALVTLDLAVAPNETDATCNDGIDNDCNGLVDCEQDSCRGARRFCGAGGCLGEQRCQVPDWGACQGLTPHPENTPTACHNSIDDDCDGLVDCADPDCNAPLCTSCGC